MTTAAAEIHNPPHTRQLQAWSCLRHRAECPSAAIVGISMTTLLEILAAGRNSIPAHTHRNINERILPIKI